MCGLIFFVILLQSCENKTQSDKTLIIWKDQRAVAVSFPVRYIEEISSDSVSRIVKIRLLSKDKSAAILGDFSIMDQTILFTPLIPFTHGLSYEIFIKGKQIDTFEIQGNKSYDAPALLVMYPSADTLPENILKVYLHFSHPMREGQSGKYVTLVKNNSDTIKGAFLDLQPELWNSDRTVLTLWLDPGRIKRDLIPNKMLGAPLKKNGFYQITVSKDWTDESGNSLNQSFTKSFITTNRDSLSPDPDHWKVSLPLNGTSEALKIDFQEALDHGLLLKTLIIKSRKGQIVSGKWQILNKEKACVFSPDQKWVSGNYIIQVASKLEDLAGNNLNRTFERDITKKENKKNFGDFADISFQVKD